MGTFLCILLRISKIITTFAAMLGKRCAIWILVIVCCAGMWSCSSHRLEEAQATVAMADSLWHNGQCLSDSTQLAQAYHTLHRRRAVYPDEYAHACYHYGKLLRAKDDPVAAMQCFINASHSRTHDYHILGRIYSNMGSICHLAGEYALSYDMYERSANVFLQDRDTLSYYYLLNDMAYEMAEQGKKANCYSILENITGHWSTDSMLIAYCLMSRAQACLRCQQYDSMIIYAHKSRYYYPSSSASTMQLAQAYSHIGKKDSATYYANQVLTTSKALSDINNALYILTNDDETQDNVLIRQTAAKRADTHKLLAVRQGKLSQAVQLLEQDFTQKPNLWWLYSILITLAFVGSGIIIYVYRKRKRQALLVQKLELLQQVTSTIQNKNEELTECYMQNHKQILEDINNKCSMLQDPDKIKKTLAWKNYNKMCVIVDKQFYLLASKLRSKQILNETEIRICVLTLLDCGYDQMAELLYRSSSSIGTLKMRVAKKFGTFSKQLRQYLIENECIK